MSDCSYPQFSYPVLNPKTSLAFISPSDAAQIEATRFLYVSALAAYLWDVLCTLGQDYQLLTQYTINVPTIAYFVSRIATLAFATTGAIFYVSPVRSCHALTIASGWCWAIAAPSTSLLFFFRARAVFDGNRIILALFGILWLATLGGSLSVPFSITGAHIADTDRCWNTSIQTRSSSGIIASTCNDTLIFIAISWHVIMRTSVKSRVKSFFGSRELPFVSRELIKGGQQYYFVTVAFNIVTMALILTPSTPPLVRAMFPVPSRAIENSMACRVFRDIKLGRNTSESHSSGTEHRPTTMSSGTPAYALRTFRRTEHGTTRDPVVEIRTTVERFDDRESMHMAMKDEGSKPGPFPPAHAQDPEAYV